MEQEQDTPQETDPESSTPTQESQVTAEELRSQADSLFSLCAKGRLLTRDGAEAACAALALRAAASALEAREAEVARLKARQLPDDLAHCSGWEDVGGRRFLLSAMRNKSDEGEWFWQAISGADDMHLQGWAASYEDAIEDARAAAGEVRDV